MASPSSTCQASSRSAWFCAHLLNLIKEHDAARPPPHGLRQLASILVALEACRPQQHTCRSTNTLHHIELKDALRQPSSGENKHTLGKDREERPSHQCLPLSCSHRVLGANASRNDYRCGCTCSMGAGIHEEAKRAAGAGQRDA